MSFLAYYDLEDLAVLDREPCVTPRTERSLAEQQIMELIAPVDRRVYRRLCETHGGPGECWAHVPKTAAASPAILADTHNHA